MEVVRTVSRSESLGDRLALMRATLDREPVGIALLTYPELLYTYANPAMRRVLGTDPVGRSQDETCSDFPWPPRAKLANVAERGSTLTTRDSRWVMPRVPGAPPEELFFTFEVARVMVGHTVFLLATAVETTDEVEARRRADGIIDQMGEVLDCVFESILSLDEHWRITFANKPAAEQFGRPRESLLHRAFTDLFGEYEGGQLQERLRPTLERRESADFEIALPQHGTRYRVRAFTAKSGISVYLAPLDAAQHVDARAADERMRVILGMVDTAVTVFDGDMRIAELNDAACEILGASRRDLMGRMLTEVLGEYEAQPWMRHMVESLHERRAFRVHAKHGGLLYEHRGVPVEEGAVMVSRPAGQGGELT